MGMHNRIRELRKYLGLTQKEFGEKLFSSLRTIQNWESGNRNISEHSIRLIESVFSVSKEWLRFGKGHMLLSSYNNDQDALIFDPDNPMLAKNHISLPGFCFDEESYIMVATDKHMYPHIKQGDIVFWYPAEKKDIISGAICVYEDIKNVLTLRRTFITNINTLILVSDSNNTTPTELSKSNLKLIGITKEYWSRTCF